MGQDNNLLLLTEFCEEHSLKYFLLKNPGKLSNSQKCSILFDIAKAILYLHSQFPPVIHRDIKSDNIFIKKEGTAKLGDFGISKFEEIALEAEYRTETVGTLQYMAPESMHSSSYSTASDIYSFGVVGWELLAEEPPFQDKPEFNLIESVATHREKLCLKKIKSQVPSVLKDLLSQCMNFNASERPSAETVCEVLSKL